MAEPVWGLLEKSQVDNETIEQAIARLITAHLADAAAHTDGGESLETHKDQPVVDHPVGSLKADKDTHDEIIEKCIFESLDGWNIIGNVTITELFTAGLYIEWGVVNVSRMWGTIIYPGHFLNYAKNILLQTTFWIREDTNTIATVVLGHWVADNNIEGFGYQIINGVVKGFWGDGAGPTFTADLNIDATIPHVYRAQYDGTNKNIKFYIDGVLKATIEDISPVGDFEPDLYFRYEATGAAAESMIIKSVIISREV